MTTLSKQEVDGIREWANQVIKEENLDEDTEHVIPIIFKLCDAYLSLVKEIEDGPVVFFHGNPGGPFECGQPQNEYDTHTAKLLRIERIEE